jgi:transposase-like protein
MTYDDLCRIHLTDEKAIWSFIISRRLIDLGAICECGAHMVLLPDESAGVDKVLWRCSARECRKRRSIRNGSVFSRSRLSIEKILKIIYWWTTGSNQEFVSKQVGVSTHTIVDWFKVLRELCADSLLNSEETLGGHGKIIEVDEMKLGKRKFNRGKRVDGQWIFGMIERDNDPFKCGLIAVADRSELTLRPIIEGKVMPGTLVISDCWKSYCFLNASDQYTHQTVNHSVEFKNSTTGAHTNTIEGLWNNLRRSLPKYGTRRDLYDGYLAEFIFRKKWGGSDIFEKTLQELTKVHYY